MDHNTGDAIFFGGWLLCGVWGWLLILGYFQRAFPEDQGKDFGLHTIGFFGMILLGYVGLFIAVFWVQVQRAAHGDERRKERK